MRSTAGAAARTSSSGTLPGLATSPSIATDQGLVTSVPAFSEGSPLSVPNS
jgi:hypothetical protein